MAKPRREKVTAESMVMPPVPNLYDGLSDCLEKGHVSFASFPVEDKKGIKTLHACSQCGLMFWKN